MNGKFSGLALVLLLCLSLSVTAQKKTPNPILTADSLATGNYKDVLNSFFQLAFERLTSPDKEIRFTGTPFAVMARLDTTLLIDKKYEELKTLRRINYSIALRLDTSYKFNGFSSGIKYALINKRDETVSRAFVKMVENNARVKQLFALNVKVGQRIAAIQDSTIQEQIASEYDQFATGAKFFGALSDQLKKIVMEAADSSLRKALTENSNYNFADSADLIYQDLKANFNKNALWTVGVTDTTYKNQFVFSNVVFHSEFIKGINKYGQTTNDLELDIRSALQLVDDTLKAGRDLKRALFSFEPAINVVFKTKNTQRSYFELKFGGTYYRNFSTLYANEDRDRIFFNGTVRVRIISDIWVPIEIKYDPKNGNLFGFINVRANFKALAGAAKLLW